SGDGHAGAGAGSGKGSAGTAQRQCVREGDLFAESAAHEYDIAGLGVVDLAVAVRTDDATRGVWRLQRAADAVDAREASVGDRSDVVGVPVGRVDGGSPERVVQEVAAPGEGVRVRGAVETGDVLRARAEGVPGDGCRTDRIDECRNGG